MKKILAVGLVALLGACNAKEDHSIQYGAPRTPAANEQTAIAGAETTLSASLAPAASSDPSYGFPGLADQLVAQLSSYAVTAGAPAGAAKLAGGTTRQAFDTTGMTDCAVVNQALDGSSISVEWGSACHYEDTLNGMVVDIRGTFAWSAVTGVTEWHLTDTTTMSGTDTATGQAVTLTISAKLDGLVTVTASTITGGSTSYVELSEGLLKMGLTTTLKLDLDYTTVPAFCVTGGTMSLTQVWAPRPIGMSYEAYPDLGWNFTWTGCNQFTVAPGQSK